MISKIISSALLASLAVAAPTATTSTPVVGRSLSNFPPIQPRADYTPWKRCTTNIECIRERELTAKFQPRAERLAPRQSGNPPPPVNTLNGELRVVIEGTDTEVGFVGAEPNAAGFYTFAQGNAPRLAVNIPAANANPIKKRVVDVGPFTMTLASFAPHPNGWGNIGFVYDRTFPNTTNNTNITSTPNYTPFMFPSQVFTAWAYVTLGQNDIDGPAVPDQPNLVKDATGFNGPYRTGGWHVSDGLLSFYWTNPNVSSLPPQAFFVYVNTNGSDSGIVVTAQPEEFIEQVEGDAYRIELKFVPLVL